MYERFATEDPDTDDTAEVGHLARDLAALASRARALSDSPRLTTELRDCLRQAAELLNQADDMIAERI